MITNQGISEVYDTIATLGTIWDDNIGKHCGTYRTLQIGRPIFRLATDSQYTTLYHTILCCIKICFTILQKLYYTILYYTILYYTLLYSTLLYSTLLYSTLLYSTLLYYTSLSLLYYTLLYYTILYYAILYYIILCYTIPYQTILDSTGLQTQLSPRHLRRPPPAGSEGQDHRPGLRDWSHRLPRYFRI